MPTSNLGFVANQGDNTVSVFDLITGIFGSPIPVGLQPNRLAMTPDCTKVLVTNAADETISVIDTGSLTVVNTLTTSPGTTIPYDICISSDGLFAYCTTLLHGPCKIDLTAMTIAPCVGWTGSGNPYAICLSNDDLTIYLCDSNGDIVAYDTATMTPGATHNNGGFGTANSTMAISRDDTTLIICVDGPVITWDIATNTPTTLSGPTSSRAVAITPDGTTAWVTEDSGFLLWPVDIATNTMGSSVSIGGASLGDGSRGIAIDQAGKEIYQVNERQQAVFQVPLPTFSPQLKFINTGTDPIGICVGPITLPPPSNNTAPPLFIPRKGFISTDYQPSDFMINFLALERWANQLFSPPLSTTLFIPCKPDSQLPTTNDLDADWLTIELFAMNTIVPYLGTVTPTIPNLFIPRKTSLDTTDLTVNWDTIQRWIDNLPHP